MSLRHTILISFVFAAGLLMKKAGWGIGTGVLYFSVFLILFYAIKFLFINKKAIVKFPVFIISVIPFLLSIAVIQYRIRPDIADGWLAFAALMLAFILLRYWKPLPAITLTILPLIVILCAGFTDYRNFHNTFHSLPFETFIRNKYTYTERTIADLIIQKYQVIEKEKADLLMQKALAAISEQDLKTASENLNAAIDLDPTNAEYYQTRGYLKFSNTPLENRENLYAALKDFRRSFDLDNKKASALFLHAQVLGLLNQGRLSCKEFRLARSMDTTLNTAEFEKRYCQ
jgi:tetratricopeptide (TPR) repeat protein